MAHPETPFRLCPTRVDSAPVLLAHKVDRARCQDRQRDRYHKCFTCAWNNNYVALHGEPEPQPAAMPDTAVAEPTAESPAAEAEPEAADLAATRAG